jgi:Ser/Thr protein kinase RdoA (MazF antagonist)
MTPPNIIPESLADAFGLAPADFTFLTEVQNTVFAFRKDGSDFILRLTPGAHRTFEQVQAEIAWINHLASQGLRVSTPVAGTEEQFCRPIEWKEQTWTAVSFTRAPGRIGAASDWNPRTFQAWGRMTAAMHLAAETYRPLSPARHDWKHNLPHRAPGSEDEALALAKLGALVEQLSSLPRSPAHFGLIHSDLHFWNFAVDDEGPTIFDFDNCEYHWFPADLGTIIFEASTCIHQRLPRQEFIVCFLQEFLAGYRLLREADTLLPHLPAFAKLREIQIFLTLSRRWADREIGPFQKAFFAATREAVLTDRPFVEDDTKAAAIRLLRP